MEAVIGHEPEQLVFNERSTNAKAPAVALVGGLEIDRSKHAGGGSRHLDRGELVRGAKIVVATVVIRFAVNVIAPALGHGVDHAAGRTHVFGRGIRGSYVEVIQRRPAR